MSKTLITLGDPGGIGYEIFLKSLEKIRNRGVIVIGNKSALKYYSDIFNLEINLEGIEFINIGSENFIPQVGTNSEKNGLIAIESINKALELIKKDNNMNLLTGPISKKAVIMAGYRKFKGHTEYLAETFNVKQYTMLLANPYFCVALVTIHEPISKVPSLIDRESIKKTILHINDYKKKMKDEEKIIYVCGLNPHAGEDGEIGKEDTEIIKPLIEELKKENIKIEGPYPADSIFKKGFSKEARYFVAMYHDQGLIPLKMISDSVVNITLGLPFFRISVGHGTGFDIAGKGLANNSSFLECLSFLGINS